VGIWTTSLAILTPKPIFGLVRECADRVQRKNRQASAQRPERQRTEEGKGILENLRRLSIFRCAKFFPDNNVKKYYFSFGGNRVIRCYTTKRHAMVTIEDSRKSIYDNAKTHFLGNFPPSLPIEQAYVHIGMYLGWVIDRGLYSEYFEDEASAEIFRFKRREISCTILSEIWDGYLGYELFSYNGNLFTYYYYGGGLYHSDYRNRLVKNLPSLYHVNDSWENYQKMKACMDLRFDDWKKLAGVAESD
jgi:hypothetical protein